MMHHMVREVEDGHHFVGSGPADNSTGDVEVDHGVLCQPRLNQRTGVFAIHFGKR